MKRRLPPLKTLLAFEAAARNESFVRAAAELNVTPSAVSHQIKLLEDHVGIALFRRRARAVTLTEAGRDALPEIRRGFDAFQGALARLDRRRDRRPLVISVVPSFAMKWLIPRLERYRGGAQVQIIATRDRADLAAGEADAAIRFGLGLYPGLAADRLFKETITPLCAPRWVEGRKALRRPRDLARVPLLHDDSMAFAPLAPDWKSWLAAAGAPGVPADDGPRFTAPEQLLEAAMAGAGIALGRLTLAAADIRAGRLVAPFAVTLALQPAYYLLTLPGVAETVPEVAAFRAWLLAEAGAFLSPAGPAGP